MGPTTRFIFPVEGLGQGQVEIVDKGQNLLRQIVHRREIAAFE